MIKLDNWKLVSLVLAIAVTGLIGGHALADKGDSNAQPADKMAVDGSSLEIMTTEVSDGATSEEHTILSGEMRTSSVTDLIFQVTAECALWTDVVTVGNDESQAVATVNVWVELDGEPVAVSGAEDSNADVVFCHRDYEVVTHEWENENATTERYLETRQANAFNWITLDVGNGIHDIKVKAQLEAHVEGTGTAQAAIGDRTLVVDPVKLAPNADI